ncbi:MAG: amidohydrolase family protein, partial [Mycobacteriales bacterium]
APPGTWLVPTLVAPQGVLDAIAAGAQLPPAIVAKAEEVCDLHAASFRRAVEAGVRIAMGTDSGVAPHGRNLRELALMGRGGMAPAQVLAAATSSAAHLLGVAADRGTIEPGKRADLVLVEGDPYDLEKLPDLVASVYQDGRQVSRRATIDQ